MKRLIAKTALFLLISLSVFFLIKFATRKNSLRDYNTAFVDKLKILQAHKGEKKIVLVGGSAMGWGLSAEYIEKRLGITTINIGHHAGLGLVDFQAFLMKNLTPEDIIVFGPEWHLYHTPDFYDGATLKNLVKNNYEYGVLTDNPERIWESIFSNILLTTEDRAIPHNSPYTYQCYNKHGDIISQCGLKPSGPGYYEVKHLPLQIDRFPDLFPFLAAHKTIILFPPTQEKVYADNKDYLEKIEQTLVAKKYTIADHVGDNVYPDSVFFDLGYHITCDFRLARTEKFVRCLDSVMRAER